MNTPRHRTAAALLALAASACGAARDAHRAPEDAAGQRWSLVEELRIGSVDDPDELDVPYVVAYGIERGGV